VEDIADASATMPEPFPRLLGSRVFVNRRTAILESDPGTCQIQINYSCIHIYWRTCGSHNVSKQFKG
jgi:hypothetical protein